MSECVRTIARTSQCGQYVTVVKYVSLELLFCEKERKRCLHRVVAGPGGTYVRVLAALMAQPKVRFTLYGRHDA